MLTIDSVARLMVKHVWLLQFNFSPVLPHASTHTVALEELPAFQYLVCVHFTLSLPVLLART